MQKCQQEANDAATIDQKKKAEQNAQKANRDAYVEDHAPLTVAAVRQLVTIRLLHQPEMDNKVDKNKNVWAKIAEK